MPFLLELFPEAAVVVIMRLPVHVAASHLDQPWAPSTLDGVLGWLEPVYRRWLAQLGHRPPPAPARPVRDVGPAGVAGPGQG